MNIGFTGTHKGMTDNQKKALFEFLQRFRYTDARFHHGDCLGADAEAAAAALGLGLKVVQHPPTNDLHRAHTEAHEYRDPAPYLERNHNIVRSTGVLLAAPSTKQEQLRSGTWATVRYARKLNRSIIFLWP